MRHRLRDRADTSASPPSRRRLAHPTQRLRRAARERKSATSTQGASLGLAPARSPADSAMDSECSSPASPCDGVFFSATELEELLGVEEEEATDWFKEGERLEGEDAPLADLLQELVGCVDVANPHNGVSAGVKQAEARPANMAAAVPARANGCYPGNKNALAARLNRLRKKEYVSGLETRVTRLANENHQLLRERQVLGARVRELEEEARYLRVVLANDSSLSQLLGRLTGLGGVKLSTSLFRDPPTGGDHDYALPGLREPPGPEVTGEEGVSPGGVCLHVDQEKVSVEFCASCARNASSAAKIFSFR
ncbi:hypothetical protein FKM82_009839 [Ascaphus truei]|uniref:CREB/ATF bZIP transcription factor n=1 Tax=Ascaphus truei TaxID=8439 RepID=UPI003F59378D